MNVLLLPVPYSGAVTVTGGFRLGKSLRRTSAAGKGLNHLMGIFTVNSGRCF